MTCPYQIDVAAYLLDALEPVETGRIREHLSECPDCAAQYDELRGLPALLRTLTMADVQDILAPAEPSPELCEALISRAAIRRRRRGLNQLLGVSVAAAVLAAGLITGGVVLSRPPPSVPGVTAVSAADPHTHVHASVTLTSRSWGTQIRLRLSGVAWAQHCVLMVTAADGRQDTAATWVATYQGTADITGTTAISAGQISHLDIITTAGRRLASLPPPTWPH
jgi:predicted anti-sigma-YlaC factor YlaD